MAQHPPHYTRGHIEVWDFIRDQKDYENVLKIKTDLDNFYASKKTILVDFKLIVLTVISIFFPKSMSKLFNTYVLKILNKIEETEKGQITAGSNLDFEDNCKKPIFRAN